ncbi:uncharacterized protein C8R40DRAFT_995706, partial [Lentinula edodes]|uniref:uncharacterized protein n=1 Tax=Lentinula edodes TaxID=5353 RepID=UPI001E8D1787
GLLGRLMKDVPLEICYEIFSYCGPEDLLHLSRTCKDLRSILLRKSLERLWRTTRESADSGLPPLPQDLNEPQFARLLFDKNCHVR